MFTSLLEDWGHLFPCVEPQLSQLSLSLYTLPHHPLTPPGSGGKHKQLISLCEHQDSTNLPFLLQTLLTLHHSSSHTLKSTLHGSLNIRVTCPVSHTIRWISKDLTANRHIAPDLSHLNTGAALWGIFVLSRHSTMGQPGPSGFIRTTCLSRSTISQTSFFPPEEEENNLECFLLTCMPLLKLLWECENMCVLCLLSEMMKTVCFIQSSWWISTQAVRGVFLLLVNSAWKGQKTVSAACEKCKYKVVKGAVLFRAGPHESHWPSYRGYMFRFGMYGVVLWWSVSVRM